MNQTETRERDAVDEMTLAIADACKRGHAPPEWLKTYHLDGSRTVVSSDSRGELRVKTVRPKAAA